MIPFVFMIAAFVSVFVLPSVCVMVLAVVAGFFSPLVPLAVGIFADVLYLPAHQFPFMTVWGALGSVGLYFVQRFVKTSIIDY